MGITGIREGANGGKGGKGRRKRESPRLPRLVNSADLFAGTKLSKLVLFSWGGKERDAPGCNSDSIGRGAYRTVERNVGDQWAGGVGAI